MMLFTLLPQKEFADQLMVVARQDHLGRLTPPFLCN